MSPEQDDVQVEDTTAETEDATQGTETREKLTQFEGQNLLNSLLTDPNVNKIITASREGRKVQVVDEVAETPEETDEGLEALDDDAGKQLVGLLDKKLAPLIEKVNALEGVADQYEERTVTAQIQEAQSAHKDFNEYRKAMSALSQENPNLKIPQLYLLAKSQAGKLHIEVPSTDSEKPTPTPRSPRTQEMKAGSRAGHKGFRNIMADALEKTIDAD